MIYEYNGSNVTDGLYYFYASWNSNCNTIKNRINRIDKEYNNLTIYRVNTTKYIKLKNDMNINKIPSFIFIKNNEIVSRISGNVDYYTLSNWLKENLNKNW